MRLKSIRNCIILFPDEIEKWQLQKNDQLYIHCGGSVEITFNRRIVHLSNGPVLLAQNYATSNVSIKNIDDKSAVIRSLQFTCSTNIPKTLLALDLDPSPFESIISEGQIIEEIACTITTILKKLHIDQIDNNQPSSNHKKIDPRLIKINRFIRKNYCSLISLDSLADMVGVHPTYLCNAYSKVFKKSPIYHTNQLRMEKAKQLMNWSDQPIALISAIVGFQNPSHFTAIFKRFYSMTPSEYRNRS